MPFGKNRSGYNDNIQANLYAFVDAIQSKDINLYNKDFRAIPALTCIKQGDFVYADPPYLISEAAYNKGWTPQHDTDLMDLLDCLNTHDIYFALSNVLEHNGKQNTRLMSWSKNYNVYPLSVNYTHCNYHAHNRQQPTLEVLITNYKNNHHYD